MDKQLLEHCEKEALHLSGAIQPHGSLLMLDGEGWISHASQNIDRHLGAPAQDWLGKVLPPRLSELMTPLGRQPGSRLVQVCGHAHAGMELDVVYSRGHDNAVAVELSPHRARQSSVPGAASAQRLGALSTAIDVAAQRQALVELVRDRTGFQRVMYYSFRSDGDGEVQAEAREGDTYGSYLGLRFPASDIPQIARQLYLKNPWRLIPDGSADPVPLYGRTESPPDLTWSDLRSVSPVHRVYMANMGVRASLSVPVVIGGNLAALIAAHHCEACVLPLDLLEGVAAQVRSHALALASHLSHQRMHMLDGLVHRFDHVRAVLQRHGALDSAWPELAGWLRAEFRVDGAILCLGDHVLGDGVTFEPAALDAVDHWFCAQPSEVVWQGDSLSRQLAHYPLSEIAGVLAIRIGGGLRLYLTRCEHIHEVTWGGNPDKPVEHHDGALGIAPRRSFEHWVEKRLGYSRPWDNESRLMALKLRELLQSEARF